MKTRIFLLTTLVATGLLFASCSKDNSLMEETSSMEMKTTQTGESDQGGIPVSLQNSPDPFTSSTTIQYGVKKAEWVILTVYQSNSERVIVLVNEFQKPGKHQVEFDGSDLLPGTYIAVLQIGEAVYRDQMTRKHTFRKENHPISD